MGRGQRRFLEFSTGRVVLKHSCVDCFGWCWGQGEQHKAGSINETNSRDSVRSAASLCTTHEVEALFCRNSDNKNAA